jgi:hypothetical protein
MSKFDERFARQYRYELPSEFPLTSPCSDIVHHLSGPTICAHTQTSLRRSPLAVGARVPTVTFIAHTMSTIAYSHTCVDSLVRVSRRVGWTLDSSGTRRRTFLPNAARRERHDQIEPRALGSGTRNDRLRPFQKRPPRGTPQPVHQRWQGHGFIHAAGTRAGAACEICAIQTPVDAHATISGTHATRRRMHISCCIKGPNAYSAAISGTFNSLSKVLSTFPSRYLFTIVFGAVFSHRWNLPPN